uniref:E3 ubiquitin-protein ligase MARCHF2 n=1 Tax=Laticauda laticaudata TaxID=8630 RepID=A0A8C5WRK6_LATLA
MTTGDCCHLPGSLCDCPGSATLSKSVEDSDLGRPQYVTQVTAKDGRLLSTVIKALGTQSDGPICRICHEGGNGEGLLSPCDCTGTLGTVHKSCLEKWLSSSNTSYCELCHTEFMVERRPRPLTEWLKHPGPRNEKRTLFCDMACFLFITPLAAISGWLCLRGAQDHMQFNSHLEAIGLIALTIALFTIYVLWTLGHPCLTTALWPQHQCFAWPLALLRLQASKKCASGHVRGTWWMRLLELPPRDEAGVRTWVAWLRGP